MEADLQQEQTAVQEPAGQSPTSEMIIEQVLANYREARLDGYGNRIVEFYAHFSEEDFATAATALLEAAVPHAIARSVKNDPESVCPERPRP